ncbi:imidazolonepropionase-like amidohydrolase [Tamaricihabitans halophyticus]|uniref:Imidazolonepropionase-like amidohydrolase n=1 Tax=Tamaricihabitans halophyticus TaxID=1262583 RepID=A0A4R2R434_9PSEU|nr:imidazolonepropionase-like amidohydrolase [Tamaricihabitans halophyticus]
MEDVLLDNATVLDVRTGELLPDRRVLVHDGLIAEVGGTEVAASGARVVDLAGKTVLPGLIDAHVHVTAVTADLAAQAEWSPNYVAARSGRILRDMLLRGFTTVRDVGGADYGLAEAVAEGLLPGPRIVFGGKALSQTGGHADLRHRGRLAFDQHRCCPSMGVVCDGVPEVRRATREQLRTGADHIKIMLSGGVASPTDRVDSTQFAIEEIRAIVEEAEAANRYVTGHAYTAAAINRGLANGVRCIEHGNLLDDTSLALFREHDAFLVPTLVTYHQLAAAGLDYGLPPESHRKVDDVLGRGLDALRRAYEAGVNLVYGTDLLGGMHPHQLGEFAIRAQVQPPIEVIRAATVNAARLLRMTGEVGEVIPGATADLLIVDGDPTTDIGILDGSRHEFVMRAGQLHEVRG